MLHSWRELPCAGAVFSSTPGVGSRLGRHHSRGLMRFGRRARSSGRSSPSSGIGTEHDQLLVGPGQSDPCERCGANLGDTCDESTASRVGRFHHPGPWRYRGRSLFPSHRGSSFCRAWTDRTAGAQLGRPENTGTRVGPFTRPTACSLHVGWNLMSRGCPATDRTRLEPAQVDLARRVALSGTAFGL